MSHISIPNNTRLEKSYDMSNTEIDSIKFGHSVEISGDYIF